MHRVWYVIRKPTGEERRWWPMADHVIEPRTLSPMPSPDDFVTGARR